MSAGPEAVTSPGRRAVNREPALLVVSEVVKSYGAVHAVRNCSFELHAGGIKGLIGPNGSGKSTLVNLLSGTQLPDQGTVTLAGKDITKWSPDKRANNGLVRTFQSARLWKSMSVAENLLVAAPARGRNSILRALFRPAGLGAVEAEDRDKAEALLHRLNLWRLREARAGELSGGQARLLEFGRILMSGATVALLDEPLAGVNPVLADEVVSGIETLAESGVTVLLIEHDLPIVRRLCTTVLGMSLGQIILHGTLDELASTELFADAYLGASTKSKGSKA
ncbi:MAG: branched-chain amino acid transport system ATP-binding protein [Frankiales bacterium]|jgi:branched-chain amino acid transport system ATP-binding protein|nr:branched-chain amino acid transport system ATP-binding protein [Frankiales bacterium]MDX6208399.1 branched-chain amino acid transport system ATP-binding protein [Frankiales bacterium]MDX6211343.1 branched-chain amino acid transport system ATP-binding protein [Frankiales bacterium]